MNADDPVVFEDLDREECLELLATQAVGRIAISQLRDAPLVVPVNYVIDGDFVQFRSGYGTKMRTLTARPVSFQVDWHDLSMRVGWSVLARGRAEEIRLRDSRPPLPEPWMPDDKPYLIRVRIRAISGRRIRRPNSTQDLVSKIPGELQMTQSRKP